MKLCDNFTCDAELLIVFRLTELLRISIVSLKLTMESLYLKSVFKKILFIETLKETMKSKIKLNSEHLFEMVTLEIN